VTMAPSARVLLFRFNLHVESSPLTQKIGKILGIWFQLFLPKFESVFHVKHPDFLEFGKGEEERME
jgi:hypothetical protein